MQKLPKALIKKYGISKKAWSVFRSQKGKTTRTKTKTQTRGANMAKRKKSRSKSLFGRIGEMDKPIQLDSMIYGAGRQRISSWVSSKVGNIPGGDLSDELAMGVISYFAAKKGSGMIRDIGRKGLVVENARVGEALIDGSAFGKSTSSNGVKVI